MEILFIILIYIFHCFTAFSLIYSSDEAKIWGDGCEKNLTMPTIDDWETKHPQEEFDYSWKYERKKYIEKTICSAHHYFLLRKEIYYNQSVDNFTTGFILQLFSLTMLTQMIVKTEVIKTWILAAILSVLICFVGCSAVGLVYRKSKICKGIRIKHFNYEEYKDCSNDVFIQVHYEYLLSIKATVCFRANIDKILNKASFIIYLLFFFRVPN